MLPRRLAPVGLLVALGCGERTLTLSHPGSSEIQSLIVAVPNGPRLEVYAIDLTQAEPWLDRVVSDEAPFDLTALAYQDTLAGLGLAPGPIESVSELDCGARPLPTPVSVHSTHVDPSERPSGEWQMLEEVPELVADFRLAGPCPCRDVEILVDVELPGQVVRGASRIDGRRALVPVASTALAYAYYEVGPDGAVPMDLPGATSQPGSTAYFDDENIWIGASDGLYHGGRTTPFTLIADENAVGAVDAIAGPVADDFYFVSARASLHRFHDGAPDTIVSSPIRDSGQDGLLAKLGPGHYAAAVTKTYQIVRLAGGGLEDMFTVPPDTQGATAVSRGADGGLYVGTSLGINLRLEGNQFLAIDGEALGSVTVMAPFADGVLAGSQAGGLRQISGRFGYCPLQAAVSELRFTNVVELDDGLLFMGPANDGKAHAILLR